MILHPGRPSAVELVRYYASLSLTTGSPRLDQVLGGLSPPLLVVMPTVMAGGQHRAGVLAPSGASCWPPQCRRNVGPGLVPLLRVVIEHRALSLVRPGGLLHFSDADLISMPVVDSSNLRITGAEDDVIRDVTAALAATAPSDFWIMDGVTAIWGDLVGSLLDYGFGYEADLPILLRHPSRRRMCVVIATLTLEARPAGWEQYADVIVQLHSTRRRNDVLELDGVDESVILQRQHTLFAEINHHEQTLRGQWWNDPTRTARRPQ